MKILHFRQIAILTAVVVGISVPSAVAQSTTVSADRPANHRADNSGKRLAIANFSDNVEESKKAMSKSVDSLKKSVESFGKHVGDNYLPKVKNKTVTVKVPDVEIPPNLQDLCEDCITSSQQMAQFVREHAIEFASVFAKYFKQFSDSPRMTPVSNPYEVDGRIIHHTTKFEEFAQRNANKLFTPEGRLKTVVQR